MWKYFLIFLLFVGIAYGGEGIGEIAWPDVGDQYYAAETGGNAGVTTLSLNSYVVMNLNLDEIYDKRNCFTTNAHEICYDCVHDIQVQLEMSVSTDRTAGAGTDHVEFAFGKDTTGAIGNGDEIGDEFHRSFSVNAAHSMGSLSHSTTLVTTDCISLLGKTDDVAGGANFEIEAGGISIIEP